jgi:hypothetical protein
MLARFRRSTTRTAFTVLAAVLGACETSSKTVSGPQEPNAGLLDDLLPDSLTPNGDMPPGTVSDLAVTGASDTSVTLTFTEVSDGTGSPANYDVRYAIAPLAWGSANDVTQGTCRVPMAGAAIGATRSCTVLGLAAATTYELQLVPFRGTLNADAVFGDLSNVVSATTLVDSIPTPPPPPPPAGEWLHEPSGFTVIEEAGWESGSLGNWVLYNWSSDKPITIVAITGSPLGEAKALQIGYQAGHMGGGGTEARYDIPPALQRREMFVGYYVRVNAAWQGHESGINKMIFLADGSSDGFSAMWYEMYGSGSSPLGLYLVNQSGYAPGGMVENVNAVNFTRGVWHKVEIYQKQGQPGIVRVWVDGVLAIDRADVMTRDAPIDAVAISGIWGGVGDVKHQFDYMRFDRIRVSVR